MEIAIEQLTLAAAVAKEEDSELAKAIGTAAKALKLSDADVTASTLKFLEDIHETVDEVSALAGSLVVSAIALAKRAAEL